MKTSRALLAACFCSAIGWGQPVQPQAAVLTPADLATLCDRLATLMDAGGYSVPNLQRAGAPLVEAMKGTCAQVRLLPNRSQPSYAMVQTLRAYLALSDAVPKPFPFPDAAQKQFAELRDAGSRLDTHMQGILEFNDRRLVPSDPGNLARYSDDNRRVPAPPAENLRVVFFGDSITDYWRLNEYFPDKDYINRGISGQTTGEMLQRMRADVLALRPKAMVLLAGTNDLARGIPVEAIEANLQSIAELAAQNKIKLVFASLLPVSDYHKDQNPAYERTPTRPLASIRALNEWIRTYCMRNNATYLDYYSSLTDDRGQFYTDMADDGLHPNAKGYRLMAPLVAAALEKELAPPPTPVKPRRRLIPSF